MRKRAMAEAAAVIVFTLAVACFSGHVKDKAEQISDGTEVQNLTAGVTTVLNTQGIRPVSLNAGISSVFVDFSVAEVGVTEMDEPVVAAAKEEASQEETEQTETAEDADAEDSTVEEEQASVYGYTNLGIVQVESHLNVRESASAESAILAKMPNHAACEIVETDGEWAHIISGNVEGYVSCDYLLTGKDALAIAEEEKEQIVTVNVNNLRVRQAASTEAEVITKVSSGEEFLVVEILDGWYKIQIDNTEGYVCADYVTLSEHLKTAESMTELKHGEGVSDVRVDLVENALQYVGNKYVWGGTSLTNGVDCSGFTMQIYKQYGISLPHSSKAQPAYGTKISASDAQPGDLFFYGENGTISHVAIYIGNGQIVHASNSKSGIKISNANYRAPICVVSYLGN